MHVHVAQPHRNSLMVELLGGLCLVPCVYVIDRCPSNKQIPVPNHRTFFLGMQAKTSQGRHSRPQLLLCPCLVSRNDDSSSVSLAGPKVALLVKGKPRPLLKTSDCSNTAFPVRLALSVLLGIIHGQENKRSKLSEDTEQKAQHATQTVRTW